MSILAIDPDTGKLRWHFQQVPWEIWDYTATMNMILADLTIDGRQRKVLMQAPKNGFFYVLDRATGAVIRAKPFVYVNWASGLDSAGRPILTGKALYRDRPAAIFPTQSGAHNWQPMAFNRQTGLVYIPAREQGMIMFAENEYRWRPGDVNMGAGAIFGELPKEFKASQELPMQVPPELARQFIEAARGEPSMATREFLLAWDPVTQQERWRVPIATTEWIGGGVLTTAGNLVIQGTGSGQLAVYRATTGEKLHEIDVGTGIIAAPVSYEIDGEQFIAVIAGFGGALNVALSPVVAATRYENYGRILAFKLGGGTTPMPPARKPAPVPEPPAAEWYTDSAAARGAGLYAHRCARCHGGRGEAQLSAYPDLHRMPAEVHAAFDSIVLGGVPGRGRDGELRRRAHTRGRAGAAGLFHPGAADPVPRVPCDETLRKAQSRGGLPARPCSCVGGLEARPYLGLCCCQAQSPSCAESCAAAFMAALPMTTIFALSQRDSGRPTASAAITFARWFRTGAATLTRSSNHSLHTCA